MECPRCVTSTLVELDRAGILIDRCTRCRGVWLDRGELDKLIAADRALDDDGAGAEVERAPSARPGRDRAAARRDDDDDDDDRGGGRRGFFWSLFD